MAETVQEKAYIYYRRHRRGLFLLCSPPLE